MNTNYNGHSRKSGIYQIRNLINGKVYIGSAKRFKSRFAHHLNSLSKGTHHNKHLQGAFNRDGSGAFIFEVLEVVEGEQTDRLLVEQKHLDSYQESWENCYNFKKQSKAVPRSCCSNNPEETQKKRKETCLERYGVEAWAQTDEAKENLRQKFTGIKRTPEEIEKAAAARRGSKWSEETRKKYYDSRYTTKERNRLSKWSKSLWENPKYRQKKTEEAKCRVTSKETRQKMREAKLGTKASLETRQKLSKIRTGKKLPPRTEEYRKKMSKSKLGKKVHSEESKRRMSESKKGKAAIKPLRSVSQFSLSGEFIKNYESVILAARELGIYDSNIHKACKGTISQTGGFLWKYTETQQYI